MKRALISGTAILLVMGLGAGMGFEFLFQNAADRTSSGSRWDREPVPEFTTVELRELAVDRPLPDVEAVPIAPSLLPPPSDEEAVLIPSPISLVPLIATEPASFAILRNLPAIKPSLKLPEPSLKGYQLASLDTDNQRSFIENRQLTDDRMSRWDLTSALVRQDQALPTGVQATRVEVEKTARLLHIFDGTRLIKSYPIDLGFSPVGHKTVEGDGKTPEGDYTIDWRNPNSQFYRSLHISYPSQADSQLAAMRGQRPGGAIMIHGRPNGMTDAMPLGPDWTAGCVAVTNGMMDELWRTVKDGTPIKILP